MIFFKGKISVESLVNYLNGTIDHSTQQEIEKWIASGRENQEFFLRLKDIWKNHEDLSSLLAETRKADWARIAELCKPGNQDIDNKNVRSLNFKKVFRRLAAAIILLIFTALGYYSGKIQRIQPLIAKATYYHEIIVPSGEKSKLKLSDGTVIWINAGSKLKLPNAFSGSSRDIWLDGEAYFEVSKDPQHPFYVHTTDVDVKVYGTKFNLKAYDNEDVFEATLVEGLVSLETKDVFNNKKEEVFLEPNRKAIFLKKKTEAITKEITQAISQPIKPRKIIISNPVPVEPAISWREGKLEFYEEPFGNIATKLERRYGVTIQILDKDIRNIKYTGVLKNISVEQALKAIQMTAEFAFEINDNVVIIKDSNLKKNKTK